MMTTLAELLQIVGRQLNRDPATIDIKADIYDDLGADDLDRIEIVLGIERGFGVSINDDAEFGVRTVADLWCLANVRPPADRSCLANCETADTCMVDGCANKKPRRAA